MIFMLKINSKNHQAKKYAYKSKKKITFEKNKKLKKKLKIEF
jgi:hypothetical protein